MKTINVFDLFSGAGGAACGYHRALTKAGYKVEITGVDIEPQSRYPFRFVQTDAMNFDLTGYDFIHASPPCQDYSTTRYILHTQDIQKIYPRLVVELRDRLIANGKPWIIENVRGALKSMCNPVEICGTTLGLRVQRHRLFDSSHLLMSSGECSHRPGDIGVYGHGASYLGTQRTPYQEKTGRTKYRPYYCRLAEAQAAMGIDWMTFDEMCEAIPPNYTQWVGAQLVEVFR